MYVESSYSEKSNAYFNHWMEIKNELSSNHKLQFKIAEITQKYYSNLKFNVNKLGNGENHIVFTTEESVKLNDEDIFIAVKLSKKTPYFLDDDFMLVEQIIGMDQAFHSENKDYKFMPYFMGMASIEDKVVLLTQDISDGKKWPIYESRRREFTHAIRVKEGVPQSFFVDPLCEGILNNKYLRAQIFKKYFKNRLVIPEEIYKKQN
ncbi:MAG: hypothetical protein AB7V77_00685 [Candidatus Woesearchaeota archaeon]